MVKIQAEVVNGKCPTCDQFTTLVGLDKAFYRCMTCGSDLEQHVNGKISYLPVMTARDDGGVPFVKEWLEQWPNKVLSSLHLEINPRNVDHGITKNPKTNKKNVKKNRRDTKARVDKHPLISYIQDMKEKQLTITSNNITQKQWSNLILELNLIKKAWASYATLNIKAPGIKKIIAHGTRTNFDKD